MCLCWCTLPGQVTQPHSTRFTTALPLILYIFLVYHEIRSRVGGILFLCLYSVDAVSLLLQSRCRPLEHLTCFAREPQMSLERSSVSPYVATYLSLYFFLLSFPFLSCRHCPAPAVSGEPPPCGFGAAVIEAPGRAHIPQQQIWGKLAAEECERFRALFLSIVAGTMWLARRLRS